MFSSTSDVNISRKIVSHELQGSGLHAWAPTKKPLISTKNKDPVFVSLTNMSFGQKNGGRSDEWMFNVIDSDGGINLRRRSCERLSCACVKKTEGYRGWRVMVLGVISAAGSGPLIRLQGSVNDEICKRIIRQHVLPYLRFSSVQPRTGQRSLSLRRDS